jgi:hypothetical protein
MSVLLLVLGILVAACGVVAIGFGIALNEFTLGTTLISGGATALTGGFILIGLSAVVSELARLADSLGRAPGRAPQRSGEVVEPVPSILPAIPVPPPVAVPLPRAPASGAPTAPPPMAPMPPRPRPDITAQPRPPAAPQQPSPSSVDVSAAAIERLRSTIPRTDSPRVEAQTGGYVEEAPLSPNGATAPYVPPGRTIAPPDVPEPRVAPEERAGGAVEALKASRLDFLFRSKPAQPAPQPESFETIWPTEPRAGRNAPPPSVPESGPRPIERQANIAPPAPAPEPQPQPAIPEAKPSATVLKSGVVDGMAYTLYTDGSIEAKLPEGIIRFGSVAELRAHIESNS